MQTYVVVAMLAVTLMLGVYVQAVGALEGGKPFATLWAAIEKLQERLDTIEGDVGSEGPAGAALHLYDGAGQDLGILMDYQDTSFRTVDPELGAMFLFQFDGVSGEPHYAVREAGFFTGPNCTGAPLISRAPQRSMYEVYRIGTKFYLPDLTSAPTTRYAPSRVGSGSEPSCVNLTEPTEILRSLELKQITLPFSLPLAWPLEIKSQL